MKIIDGNKMREALTKQIRVYLCGKLSDPEDFEFVESDGLEIGISHYDRFTVEKAHFHKWNHEYNFIMKGTVKVYLLDEDKEYELHKDDMYVIEPGMAYITKAQAGTEVIFVKSPGGNDKELISITNAIRIWGKNWESKMLEI